MDTTKVQDPEDAGLMALMNVWKRSGKDSDKDLVMKTLKYRKLVRGIFEKIFKWTTKNRTEKEKVLIPKNFDCMRDFVKTYQVSCGPWDYYSASYMGGVISTCENRTPEVHKMVKKALTNWCPAFKAARDSGDLFAPM